LADGERLDTDLAGAIATATGTPAPAPKTASSVEDLLVPGAAQGAQGTAPKPAEPGPSSLDGALGQLTGKPGEQRAGAPAAAGAGARVPLDPAKVEQFKALARQTLVNSGVPPDQVEARVDAMVAAGQRPQPAYTPPKPDKMPPPGFGEGFGDRWFDTEQGIKNLIGQGGPGAPGVLESWRDLITGTNDQLTNPVGTAIDEVKDAINSPNAAYYLGGKAADGMMATPGLMFGCEGVLAARAGALDDLAASGAIPHSLIDNPTPTGAFEHSTPLAGGEHSGGIGDHSGSPGGHGAPGGPFPFDIDSPLPTARPEFTLSNPLDHMSPHLQVLAEQHLTGSGETVLGPFAPVSGGPSYIDVAKDAQASYFDIGDAWNTSTPTQQLAANQHVLDIAIANRNTIKLSVPYYEIRPDTYTGAELRYIQKNGYQRIDDTTFVLPNGGG
jgi:hypothetical protein